MLETLLVIVLSFTGGFGTRYFTEPVKECKTIKIDMPDKLLNAHITKDCKEGIDPITQIDQSCMMKTPRWVIKDHEYKELSKYVKTMRTYLVSCQDIIVEYNKDKFVMKD